MKLQLSKQNLGMTSGALVIEDIFECYRTICEQKYRPDTLVMHPDVWNAYEDLVAFGIYLTLVPWWREKESRRRWFYKKFGFITGRIYRWTRHLRKQEDYSEAY